MYISSCFLVGIDDREKAQSLILPYLFPQFLKLRQGHPDDLIHVVVAIGGEAADKTDTGQLGGFVGILPVERCRLRRGYGIVCLLAGGVVIGVFANDGGIMVAMNDGRYYIPRKE